MSNKLNLLPVKNTVKVSRDELNHVISTLERLKEKGEISKTDAAKRLQYLNEIRNKKTKTSKLKSFLIPGKSNKSVSKEQLCLTRLTKSEIAIIYILWVRIAFVDYNSPPPDRLKYLAGFIGKNKAKKIYMDITTNMAHEDRLERNEALEDAPNRSEQEDFSEFEYADDDYIVERLYGSWDYQMGR